MNRWTSTAPIHEQLGERVILEMLGQGLCEGAALPSTREIARRYLVNPLTAERALDDLRAKGWIEASESCRDVLSAAAINRAIEAERTQFLREEWPELRRRLVRIGITASDLH